MDSQSYTAADEDEHVEPLVVYQEEGVKFYFYEFMWPWLLHFALAKTDYSFLTQYTFCGTIHVTLQCM